MTALKVGSVPQKCNVSNHGIAHSDDLNFMLLLEWIDHLMIHFRVNNNNNNYM